jgi:hypothetical protein
MNTFLESLTSRRSREVSALWVNNGGPSHRLDVIVCPATATFAPSDDDDDEGGVSVEEGSE